MRQRNYLICLIALFLLFLTFQMLTWNNLEFRTQDLYDNYRYTSLFFYVAISICIYYLLPKNKLREIIKGLGLIGLIILIIFVGIYMFPFRHNSDIEDDNQILFVNKSDSNKKIIEQVYWTGITSDHVNYDTVITEQLFKNIRWTKKIDVNKIDKNDWFLVHDK